MNIIISSEKPADYRAVEELVQEAFWNIYQPGCSEHLILHQLRQHPDYMESLSKLIWVDGQLAGQIAYCKAQLQQEQTGDVKDIALFGPFAVAPDFQRQGLGEKLVQTTLELAKEAGISHLVIMGDPCYYAKFGFTNANQAGIYLAQQDKAEQLDFLLVLDLQQDGSICPETGPWIFQDPEAYEVTPEEVEAFDKQFSEKKKEKRPGQLG